MCIRMGEMVSVVGSPWMWGSSSMSHSCRRPIFLQEPFLESLKRPQVTLLYPHGVAYDPNVLNPAPSPYYFVVFRLLKINTMTL